MSLISPLIFAGWLLTAAAVAQEAPPSPAVEAQTADAPTLDEVTALLVENYLLRLQVVEVELQRRRAVIDARIAAAHPGYAWDWQAGRLVPAEGRHDD
jgi:hypothetical protein